MKLYMYFIEIAISHFNEPVSYVIGDNSPPHGAVKLGADFTGRPLNLDIECGTHACPSVLIFTGQQWGTIDVVNCKVGQQYMFVNRSNMDLGIVVQQNGGAMGSKGIAQFDIGTCFCLQHEDAEGNIDENIDKGTMLCR